MRLDFYLSLFSGIVAGTETFAVAWYRLPLSWRTGTPSLFFGYHIGRSLVLVGAGVVAGLVGVRLRRQFLTAMKAARARDDITNFASLLEALNKKH